MPGMEFHLLGPLEVRSAAGPVEVGGPRQRAVLAALLLRAGQLATVSYLTDAVWDSPPATPLSNLRTYVSGLRQRLGRAGADAQLSTRAGGYTLSVAPDALDLMVFAGLEASADEALQLGEVTSAADALRRALALWRGRPLEGHQVGPVLAAEIARLEERRLTVFEKYVTIRMQSGDHVELVAELRRMVAEHPLREGLWAYLMEALHRAGRRADALSAYREVYRLLDSELGVEPGAVLQEVHSRVLGGQVEPAAVPVRTDARPPARVPRMLPPDVAHFVGRQRHGESVTRLFTHGADAGDKALPVVAVTGQPGVGKTALAIRAAHGLTERFPDGHLFADLHGVSRQAADPGEVLALFLRELGVADVEIPRSAEERAAMYRSRLAGSRVLVVLDNAAAEDQIRPLLPGHAGCGVIVTSRRRLAGLDVSLRVQLGPLAELQSVQLLKQLSGRSAYDDAAAHRIARLCGGLPLALRIVGTKLAVLPHLSPAGIADRLADERHRLDELTSGDREIRASFLVSYERLDPVLQHAFLSSALLPGPDFPAWATAAAIRVTVRAAERDLEQLVEMNLVECVWRDDRVRYRFHDLIRLFAEERVAEEVPAAERVTAVRRVFDAYLYLAHSADASLAFGGLHSFDADPAPVDIAELAQAIIGDAAGWFDDEHACLLAAIHRSASAGWLTVSSRLSAALVAYLELRGRWQDLATIAQLSLDGARAQGNSTVAAYALFGLGLAAREMRDVQTAQRYFEECQDLLRHTPDAGLEMLTELAVGVSLRLQGRYAAAIEVLTTHLYRAKLRDEPSWTAYSLRELGIVHRYRGEWDDAERCLRQAVDGYVLLGDARWEAACLRELGVIRRERGDHFEALRLLERARAIFATVGDVRREAVAWRDLALTYRLTQDLGQARACCRHSDELFVETLDEHGAACTNVLRGELRAAAGDLDGGLADVRRSLSVFERLGDPRWTGKTWLILGQLLHIGGDADGAVAAWRQAHAMLADLPAVEAVQARRMLQLASHLVTERR
jgi:DNA-binding SARP family transcriptional activator/tetratricopeptide (TPR) repeat protein